jgi:hypothetical protein
MSPGDYTELFFCDEAVAMAAGHRPCWQCRRPDAKRFLASWRVAHGLDQDHQVRATEIDSVLHASRVTRSREQARYSSKLGDLPDGVFVVRPDNPHGAWLVWQGRTWSWSHSGYTSNERVAVDEGVQVLTPEPLVRVLAAGYVPVVHATASTSGEPTRSP